MKIHRLVLYALVFPGLGCGSGTKTTSTTTSSSFAQVQGAWKIVLSENQVAIVVAQTSPSTQVDPNPTAIAISLVQSNGILSTSSTVYSGNTGCKTHSGWWSNTGPYEGTWEYRTFSFAFESGLVSGNTITLTLAEAESFSAGQPVAPNGQLKLLGTVQSDGSIKGTLTDSCILDSSGNPTNQTFTATTISAFPPTSWP
jgi:hypothetical protein